MNRSSKLSYWIILNCVALTFVACTPQPTATPTLAWTPLPLVSSVPLPTPVPTTAMAAPPAAVVDCFNDAEFLEDLTIPDQTIVAAGESLDKRWSVQNSGSCDWQAGYRLIRIGSDDFGSSHEIALYPARAGSNAVWQVLLTAPVQAGEHLSIWQASSPEGALFGEQVYLWVVVATPTPAPTSRGTPTN